MPTAIVSDQVQLANLKAEINRFGYPVKVSWDKPNKRSLSANGVYHVWLKLIGEFMGETKEYAEGYCKLEFGLPIIMTRQDDDHAKMIDFTFNKTGFNNWPHDKQIKYTQIIPVSRLMTTAEHKEYRDAIERYFAEKGLYLEYL